MSQVRDGAGVQGNGDECPFVPGRGTIPPYLAGRASHQRTVRDFLKRIQAGTNPESELLLYGPRGTGKTAMLLWLAAEARQQNVDVVALASADIQTNEKLVDRLSRPPGWIDRLGSVSWRGFQWKSRDRVADDLDQVLARRLRKAPLALLIDEAHTLDPTVGHTLLPTLQRLAGEAAPLLTVLAGTPGLPDQLGKMQATFWERSEVLLFDRLGERDASDAVRIPFEEAGWTITPDALEQAVSASQGYPFFLQVWGKALWGSGKGSGCTVTVDNVQPARAEFEARRNRFYGHRHRELDKLGLLPAATAVASAYRDAPELHSTAIDRILESTLQQEGRGGDRESVLDIRRQLDDVGFIWDPGEGLGGRYVPGIPSLMDFVLQSGARDRPSEIG